MEKTGLRIGRVVMALVALSVVPAMAASALGEWVTQGDKARVKIAPCSSNASQLCGNVTWSYRPADAPKRELLDVNNSNPALRSRPIVGLPLLQGFEPAGNN